jgi:hypothetical protein
VIIYHEIEKMNVKPWEWRTMQGNDNAGTRHIEERKLEEAGMDIRGKGHIGEYLSKEKTYQGERMDISGMDISGKDISRTILSGMDISGMDISGN